MLPIGIFGVDKGLIMASGITEYSKSNTDCSVELVTIRERQQDNA